MKQIAESHLKLVRSPGRSPRRSRRWPRSTRWTRRWPGHQGGHQGGRGGGQGHQGGHQGSGGGGQGQQWGHYGDYATSHADRLKTHVKTHTGEKSNKCSLFDYASSRRDDLGQTDWRHIWKDTTKTFFDMSYWCKRSNKILSMKKTCVGWQESKRMLQNLDLVWALICALDRQHNS